MQVHLRSSAGRMQLRCKAPTVRGRRFLLAPLNAGGMLNVGWVHPRHGARCCKATLLMLEQEVWRVQGGTLRGLQQQDSMLA